MKFVFFGSPKFAELVLGKLIENGFVPSLLVCNPDRPVGRKKIITPPPAKILASRNKIEIFQPEVLIESAIDARVGKFDIAVVAAYSKLIPEPVLGLPKLGTIGVHPSLLPRHRGASPIQSAILKGDLETGVTLYLMDEKLDHGPILAQKRVFIGENEDYIELEERLAGLGGELLIETMPRFIDGKIALRDQAEGEATFTSKFSTEDGYVSYDDLRAAQSGEVCESLKIHRMIRAFVEEPGVWTRIDGRRVKLLSAYIEGSKLVLRRIQFEGEKPKEVASI